MRQIGWVGGPARYGSGGEMEEYLVSGKTRWGWCEEVLIRCSGLVECSALALNFQAPCRKQHVLNSGPAACASPVGF